MNARRYFLSLAALATTSLVLACDEDPTIPNLGSMDITTTAPTAEREFTTADGWVVKLDRFLVHVTTVNVAGADQVLAASSTPQIIDQVALGAKPLLSAPLRTARPWEDVSLQIGPATAETDTVVLEPVKDADRLMMEKDRLSIYVEGKASKAGITKAFKWGFGSDTLYTDCGETQNGNVVRGLVVPTNGNDTADVGMSGDVLFSDDLVGGAPRADAIMLADADNDGVITLAELAAVPLETARAGGAPYVTPEGSEIADLEAFVTALAPRIVTRFRATGKCTPQAP
jgi:hypothetical protein